MTDHGSIGCVACMPMSRECSPGDAWVAAAISVLTIVLSRSATPAQLRAEMCSNHRLILDEARTSPILHEAGWPNG